MKALGLILAGGNSHRLKQLTDTRAIGAMPVAGCFRAIDFTLSNMTNSHIQKVGVITQYNAASMHSHLSSSKWWNFGRKQGGLFVMTPNITANNSTWLRGTADAIFQNLAFLKSSHEPYVIITNSDCIYKMDYNELLEYHVDKQADITIVVKRMDKDQSLERFGVVKMNDEMRIKEFEEKPVIATSNIVSCGIYCIRRRLLIEMIEKAAENDQFDFVKDVLIRFRDVKRIYGFEFKSYWKNIADVTDYYQCNMDFLKPDVRKLFFHDYPMIYSKVEDFPPAKFNPGSNVTNSLVSSGCIINGSIEGSVVFKNTYIGNNCHIKNSIILNNIHLEDNVTLENCIIDSRCHISANSTYISENGIRVIAERTEKFQMVST